MKNAGIPYIRVRKFAENIEPTNKVESIRLHETHATTNDICICTDHNDRNNSNLIQIGSLVVNINNKRWYS